jgi:hypothetical protein
MGASNGAGDVFIARSGEVNAPQEQNLYRPHSRESRSPGGAASCALLGLGGGHYMPLLRGSTRVLEPIPIKIALLRSWSDRG